MHKEPYVPIVQEEYLLLVQDYAFLVQDKHLCSGTRIMFLVYREKCVLLFKRMFFLLYEKKLCLYKKRMFFLYKKTNVVQEEDVLLVQEEQYKKSIFVLCENKVSGPVESQIGSSQFVMPMGQRPDAQRSGSMFLCDHERHHAITAEPASWL